MTLESMASLLHQMPHHSSAATEEQDWLFTVCSSLLDPYPSAPPPVCPSRLPLSSVARRGTCAGARSAPLPRPPSPPPPLLLPPAPVLMVILVIIFSSGSLFQPRRLRVGSAIGSGGRLLMVPWSVYQVYMPRGGRSLAWPPGNNKTNSRSTAAKIRNFLNVLPEVPEWTPYFTRVQHVLWNMGLWRFLVSLMISWIGSGMPTG